MSNLLKQIKSVYSTQSIERKDISLKDLLNKEGKNDSIVVNITSFTSKLVPKYKNEHCYGMHTMITISDKIKDGKKEVERVRKTGGFSNALFEFAKFFYNGVGLNPYDDFNKTELVGTGIQTRISIVKLDGGKSTYNFEILDGDVEGFRKMGNAMELDSNSIQMIEQ